MQQQTEAAAEAGEEAAGDGSEKEKQLLRQEAGEDAEGRESVPERSTGWDIGANGTVPVFKVGAGAASFCFLRGREVELEVGVGTEGQRREEAPVMGRRSWRRSATVKRGVAGAEASMARDWGGLEFGNFGSGGREEEEKEAESGRETRRWGAGCGALLAVG